MTINRQDQILIKNTPHIFPTSLGTFQLCYTPSILPYHPQESPHLYLTPLIFIAIYYYYDYNAYDYYFYYDNYLLLVL